MLTGGAVGEILERRILRKKSMQFFFWGSVSTLGVLMCFAVLAVSRAQGFAEGVLGCSAYLAFVSFAARIYSAKLVVTPNSLSVVNPIRTYVIPRHLVAWSLVGSDGGLRVATRDGTEIPVFAFGGSIADKLAGTSKRVEKELAEWLQGSTGEQFVGLDSETVSRITACKVGDAMMILAVFIAFISYAFSHI
jgi:hypothetical protein